jgi:hypothetical protein
MTTYTYPRCMVERPAVRFCCSRLRKLLSFTRGADAAIGLCIRPISASFGSWLRPCCDLLRPAALFCESRKKRELMVNNAQAAARKENTTAEYQTQSLVCPMQLCRIARTVIGRAWQTFRIPRSRRTVPRWATKNDSRPVGVHARSSAINKLNI